MSFPHTSGCGIWRRTLLLCRAKFVTVSVLVVRPTWPKLALHSPWSVGSGSPVHRLGGGVPLQPSGPERACKSCRFLAALSNWATASNSSCEQFARAKAFEVTAWEIKWAERMSKAEARPTHLWVLVSIQTLRRQVLEIHWRRAACCVRCC